MGVSGPTSSGIISQPPDRAAGLHATNDLGSYSSFARSLQRVVIAFPEVQDAGAVNTAFQKHMIFERRSDPDRAQGNQ